jgi:predicted ribosome quality control (RQC) complex YloA/Tae2 family protein
VTGNGKATISDIADADAQEVARQVRRVFEPLVMGSWTPTVYRQNDTVLDYSAVVFDHMAQDADVDHPESISAAIETGLETSSQAAPQDHDQLRQRLVQRIDVAQQKLGDRLRSLREQQRRAEEADSLRHAGETIYAWMWMIEPGQTVLNAEGESPIELDPALSANENAQAYFDRYRRAQRGLEQVPSRIRAAERERSYLEQLLTQVQQSQGFDALETLSQELDEYLDAHPGGRKPDQRNSKPGKRKPKSGKGSAPSQFRTPEGHTIHVGRSGKQNDQVTFSVGGPDDTWLHARGVAGSHVIVKWDTSVEEEDPATIEAAAALAAWYSSARQSGSVDVDVAKRRHVRKISGAGPGMVTYRNERTIVVAPQDEAALQEAGKLPS